MFPQTRIVELGFLLVCLMTSLGLICHAGESEPALEEGFRQPPQSINPWVDWFWMNGNITCDGITADLETMHDAGIGGCLIMHVRLGKIGQHDPLLPSGLLGPVTIQTVADSKSRSVACRRTL